MKPLLTISLICLLGCTINGNYLGVSRSMRESIQDGFFVKEFVPKQSFFSLDTLGDLKIEEVFVEKKWRSNSDLSKSVSPGSGSQLILKLENIKPNGYSFDWLCKIQNGKRFSENDNLLVTDIAENQLNDTIIVQVYRGDVFYLDSLLAPLYEIQLVKK